MVHKLSIPKYSRLLFQPKEATTDDNSTFICSRQRKALSPGWRSARIEKRLSTSEELALSNLKTAWSSSQHWTILLRHSLPNSVQELRAKHLPGNQIEKWMGPKLYTNSKTSSNSRYKSYLNSRWQVNKFLKQNERYCLSLIKLTAISPVIRRRAQRYQDASRNNIFHRGTIRRGPLLRANEVMLPKKFFSAII